MSLYKRKTYVFFIVILVLLLGVFTNLSVDEVFASSYEYVYFASSSNIFRMKTDGSNIEKISDKPSTVVMCVSK